MSHFSTVTEPFICPALYEKYVNNDKGITVLDEWTLNLAMGDKIAEEMENHYKTFIVYSFPFDTASRLADFTFRLRRTSLTLQVCKSFPSGDILLTPNFVFLAAGLNWVRIPIGFWAIETMNDEPFLVGTSWTYFLKA